MPLDAGERLGPYEILALLGKGGMGEVYRARDTRLGRDVAIKISAERFSDRFAREARAVAALNHPHICTLYDVGPSYLVMEYLEGPQLKGPLPVTEALRLATQVAEALEMAHARGLIHRDLKPGNILVTRFGAKLLDFGLAKQHGAGVEGEDVTQTIEGTVVGTVAYMSPEQAQGKPADPRSDIFSFGLVLYEMLSGRRAFTGETTIAVLAALLRQEPEPLDAPPALVRLVARCLRKLPEERFQSMADVKAALDEAGQAADPVQAPSIAVLPFANLSADKDNEYFSDGLAEEILNALTQLPGLRVIARASAFAFRGREHAIHEIGEKLKVASVLHGSVRRSGTRIRVGAQLINVADESQLWSERYDRELRDVFDIQDEIAQAIVAQLKVKLGTKAGRPLVKRYTDNLEAHSLYLKGNFHLYRLTTVEMEKGRQNLEQAVALEPAYAPAWVQLADYHIASCFLGRVSPLEGWARAREAANRAVEAGPEFADAHAAVGFVEAMSEYRWDEALARFDTALRLNPASARTHFWRGQIQVCLGRNEEAFAEIRRAVDLDPLFSLYKLLSAEYHLWARQYEIAAEQCRQMLEVDPHYPWAMALLAQVYSQIGRNAEGIALLEEVRHLAPASYYLNGFLGWLYVKGGRRSDAERFVTELEERRRRQYVPAGTIALAALALGDAERVFGWVNRAIEERDPNLPYVIRQPQFEPLRADPRYQDTLRHMNLS